MPNERIELYKEALNAQLMAMNIDQDFPWSDFGSSVISYNDIKAAIIAKGVRPSAYISYDIDLLIIKLSSLRANNYKEVEVHFIVNSAKELTVAFKAEGTTGAANEPLPYDFGDVHQ